MIWEYQNFLTDEQCELIIGLGESNQLSTGTTMGGKTGFRKAKVIWIDKKENALVADITKRVAELTGLPIENQEQFHFVKYSEGGEYKLHHDGRSRRKTALIYLNEAFVGGETEFPKVKRVIKPETGKLVIWENTTPMGTKIEKAYHAGLPIESGTKYIAVIWIRNQQRNEL